MTGVVGGEAGRVLVKMWRGVWAQRGSHWGEVES